MSLALLLGAGILGATSGALAGTVFLSKTSLGERIRENSPPISVLPQKFFFVLTTAGLASTIAVNAALEIIR